MSSYKMTLLRRSARVALRPTAAMITPDPAAPYVCLFGERLVFPDLPVDYQIRSHHFMGSLQFALSANAPNANILLFVYSSIRIVVSSSDATPYQYIFVGLYFRTVAIFSINCTCLIT